MAGEPKITTGLVAHGEKIGRILRTDEFYWLGEARFPWDAKLWAKAPDLLAELKTIVFGWRRMFDTMRAPTDWESERLEMAEALIAEAEGRG